MTNRIPDYLKLFIEEIDETPEIDPLPEFKRLWSIFPEVTGLRLNVTERENKNQLTFPWSDSKIISYKVSIEPTKRAKLYSLTAAEELEAAFSELLNELGATRKQLRLREAELAAGVPVVSVDEDGEHLAIRLEAVIRSTADMLRCTSGGLYLLDEATSTLKLRSGHKLSDAAYLKSPRPLEEAIADVEALAGHAIVIEDTSVSHFPVPEKSKSALCVPVATATSILGTLWMYRDTQGDFTPTEQNLAEITAGRLAADLERAVLTQEVRTLRDVMPVESEADQIEKSADAEAWNEGRLERLAPYIDGWDVADSRTNAKEVGDFCHWHIVAEDRVHLAVGAAHGFTNKQLSSVAFQATHAAHTMHDPKLKQLFSMANQSLWTSSIEGDASSLFHAVLDPTCGSLQYGLAGGVFAYILRPHGWEPLLSSRSVLGVDCEMDVETHRQMLMPGDILVAMSSPVPDRAFEQDNRMNQIAEKLLHNTHLSAADLSDVAKEQLEQLSCQSGLSVLVAKRRDESSTSG